MVTIWKTCLFGISGNHMDNICNNHRKTIHFLHGKDVVADPCIPYGLHMLSPPPYYVVNTWLYTMYTAYFPYILHITTATPFLHGNDMGTTWISGNDMVNMWLPIRIPHGLQM